VHLLNEDVLPAFEAADARIEVVPSAERWPRGHRSSAEGDAVPARRWGREFCGRPDRHPCALFLRLEGIDHRLTRVKRPQSNGIVERLHRTLLDERFRVEGRRTWFETVEEMQAALDAHLVTDNDKRPHQGRGMKGRTPMRVFLDGRPKTSSPVKETPERQPDPQPTAA